MVKVKEMKQGVGEEGKMSKVGGGKKWNANSERLVRMVVDGSGRTYCTVFVKCWAKGKTFNCCPHSIVQLASG